jgi:hypothetical protein
MRETYFEVTTANIPEVKEELKKSDGRLLIYSPETFSIPKGVLTGEARFDLFANALICDRNAITVRGDSRHNGSREYVLRKRRVSDDKFWESAYEMFEILKLGKGYSFEIHCQSVVYRGLLEGQNRAWYIPQHADLEEKALREAIGAFIEQINVKVGQSETGLGKLELEKMVQYAVDDLRTGKILEHNIQAGQDADVMFGM